MKNVRGLWYEEAKKRFRVRRYHNKISYLAGYFSTYDLALAALAELDRRLTEIPKQQRGTKPKALVPKNSFRDQIESLLKDVLTHPRTFKHA